MKTYLFVGAESAFAQTRLRPCSAEGSVAVMSLSACKASSQTRRGGMYHLNGRDKSSSSLYTLVAVFVGAHLEPVRPRFPSSLL